MIFFPQYNHIRPFKYCEREWGEVGVREKKETLAPCVSYVFRDLNVEVETKSPLNVKCIL